MTIIIFIIIIDLLVTEQLLYIFKQNIIELVAEIWKSRLIKEQIPLI